MRIFLAMFASIVAGCAIAAGQSTPAVPPIPQRPEQARDFATARKLLEEGIGRTPRFNVRAIIVQRLTGSSDLVQQVKVEMSTSGKLRQIVLSPLSVQGTELVDDGQFTHTYAPDSQTVVIQPSAREAADDLAFRMKLVDRNYRLRIDRKTKIAGREAVIVKAIPVADDLPTRCYSIDTKTGFLLRLETCLDGSDPQVHFETKIVDFPSDFPDGTFQLAAPMGAQTRRFTERCVSPKAAPRLKDDLMFAPAIPARLPYGFAIQDLQASTDSAVRALAVRVTDGLAKATVYEWKGGGEDHGPAPQGARIGAAGTLTLMIYGDIPDPVKERILQAFSKSGEDRQSLSISRRVLSWALELEGGGSLFPGTGDSEGLTRVFYAIPIVVSS